MADKRQKAFLAFITKGFNKANVGSSTQKSYSSVLKNVRKAMKYEGTSLHFTKEPTKIVEIVKDKSLSYQISTYSAIVKLTKDKKLKKQYSTLINDLNKTKISEAEEGKYTDKERKTIGGLTWSDLENIIPLIREELLSIDEKTEPKRYYIVYQYLILSLLYLKCKFLPRLDYCSIKVIYDKSQLIPFDIEKKEDNVNQLLVQEGYMKIYFNKFKNVKKAKQKVFVICDEIRSEISDWLFYKDNEDKNNLFYNLNKNKVYDNKRFCELIKRMFVRFLNTPVGVNHIRKLKEKHIQSSTEYINMSIKEKKEIHKTLFHTKNTAELHYNKQ